MLNSALLWKVWLRIDNSTDEVNQPISIQFDEIDTVDDLKSRFFQKLSSTRWREINDNASIAIGPVSYTHLDVYKRQGFARAGSSPAVVVIFFSVHFELSIFFFFALK